MVGRTASVISHFYSLLPGNYKLLSVECSVIYSKLACFTSQRVKVTNTKVGFFNTFIHYLEENGKVKGTVNVILSDSPLIK